MILKFLILKYTDTVSIMFSTQKHEIEEGIFTVLRSIITTFQICQMCRQFHKQVEQEACLLRAHLALAGRNGLFSHNPFSGSGWKPL